MIALESTATMSAQNTSQWLYPLWVHLFGPISTVHWNEVHHLIRKTGHFVGYGLVSVAFFYSWRQTLRRMAFKHWTAWRRASVLAVVFTLLIAISDEFHQSFIPSRTSSPVDVCIDVFRRHRRSADAVADYSALRATSKVPLRLNDATLTWEG